MSTNSESPNVSRRAFVTTVARVAATTTLIMSKAEGLVSPPPAAPDYPVMIDVTKNPISYSAGGKHAYRLHVKAGSSITWTAVTSQKNHHLAILFLKETPLVDKSGNPVYALQGSDAEEAGSGIGAGIDGEASGEYEYYVAVFDDATKTAYTDDPKIIVGSGGVSAAQDVSSALEDLRRANPRLLNEPKLHEEAESIEQRLQDLLQKLKSQ